MVTLTAQLTAGQMQSTVTSKLTKLRRGVYGTACKKTCAMFIDDLNIAATEQFGAQPPLELLRQYFDYSFVYDLKDFSQVYFENLLVIAACGVPGGSKHSIYERFLCHFNCFSINEFPVETMRRIFGGILLYRLTKNDFGSDVSAQVSQIVSATLSIYGVVINHLMPTPNKCHYIFNLRDISKVCVGCSLYRKESNTGKFNFTKLWTHETLRVFNDRLVDQDDRQWFFVQLRIVLKAVFKEEPDEIFREYISDEDGGKITSKSIQNLMFGTYADLDAIAANRRYEEVVQIDRFKEIVYNILEEHNRNQTPKMDIVLFTYALQHLNRICRVLSMPFGNALLVGAGGSGRKTLVYLAAIILKQNSTELKMSQNYGHNDWLNDMKKCLKESGGLGKDTILLLSEHRIEPFLSDVDCLLNQGEVLNMWNVDEKQEITELVRLAAKKAGFPNCELFSYFVNRCKEKLHIVLCTSSNGASFRTKIRQYPSLVSCCTVDWYEAWPDEALESVAQKYLNTMDFQKPIMCSLTKACQLFHKTVLEENDNFVRNTIYTNFVTNASFIQLLVCFKNLFHAKQAKIANETRRYKSGLEMLRGVSEAISKMQGELDKLKPKLLILTENTTKLMEDIVVKNQNAEEISEQIKSDELLARKLAEETELLDMEISNKLAGTMPVLEEAFSALDALKPKDITFVKSMKSPPDAVKLVMAAVCLMTGILPEQAKDPKSGNEILDYWTPGKRLLDDIGFLSSLRKEYDKDGIDPEIIKTIREEYMVNKLFQPVVLAKVSKWAAGLCKWIRAMEKYEAVNSFMMPKKKELTQAQELLEKTRVCLDEKRRTEEETVRSIELLSSELEETNNMKSESEKDVENCNLKLDRAGKIIRDVGDEKVRWTNILNGLNEWNNHFVGDILMSSGVISYLGPYTSMYRNNCIVAWHQFCQNLQIPCSVSFNFTELLGSDIRKQIWKLNGLSSDIFSVNNAVIMAHSMRFSKCCLFVDPQRQANIWIKNFEKKNALKCVKMAHAHFDKTLEYCVEFGKPLLIENIGGVIDAALDPILRRITFSQGGIDYVSVGDKVLPMSPNFQLYLTSNLCSPHFTPETCNKVTIINFALTRQSLVDQLIDIVVAKERPDLGEQRQTFISRNVENIMKLFEVESNILEIIGSSEADILDDEAAVEAFEKFKQIVNDIQKKQQALQKNAISIDEYGENYRPVAELASVIFYCIDNLSKIDRMYQFSVQWFFNLYITSIEKSNKSKDIEKRVKILLSTLSQNAYRIVCRSIFEKDKLMFSFILTLRILMEKGEIDNDELDFLFTLDHRNEGQSRDSTNLCPAWLPEKVWKSIISLENLGIFSDFASSLTQKPDPWRSYYEHKDPHTLTLPYPWEEKTNAFQKLIVLKAIRPDKAAEAVQNFVSIKMGSKLVTPAPFNICESFEDANVSTPLVFILSKGMDPTAALLAFAEKKKMSTSLKLLSLGQGQGSIAQKLIEEAKG